MYSRRIGDVTHSALQSGGAPQVALPILNMTADEARKSSAGARVHGCEWVASAATKGGIGTQSAGTIQA